MRCPIHHVDLVCPKCWSSKGGQQGGKSISEKKRKMATQNIALARAAHMKAAAARRVERAKTETKKVKVPVWGIHEALAYFEAHPNDKIKASNLIDAAPKVLKESAQMYAAQRLFLLCKQGHIVKIDRGIYRLRKDQNRP